MLLLLVTGAGGLSAAISFVPQHILLMPQYKLNSQRPLWRKRPAQTHHQQLHGKEAQRISLISSMKPYGLSALFRSWLSLSYRPALHVLLFAYCSWNSSLTSFTTFWCFIPLIYLRKELILLLQKHPHFQSLGSLLSKLLMCRNRRGNRTVSSAHLPLSWQFPTDLGFKKSNVKEETSEWGGKGWGFPGARYSTCNL